MTEIEDSLEILEEDREVTPEVITRLQQAIRGSGAQRFQGEKMTPRQARAYFYLSLCVAGLSQEVIDDCMQRANIYMAELDPEQAHEMASQLFRQKSNSDT